MNTEKEMNQAVLKMIKWSHFREKLDNYVGNSDTGRARLIWTQLVWSST